MGGKSTNEEEEREGTEREEQRRDEEEEDMVNEYEWMSRVKLKNAVGPILIQIEYNA